MKKSKIFLLAVVGVGVCAWNGYCSWSIEDGIDPRDARKVVGVYNDYYNQGKNPPAPSLVAKKTGISTLEVRTIAVAKQLQYQQDGVKKLKKNG